MPMDASCWCEVELEIMLRGKLPSESTFRCINPPHAHTTHTHTHTDTHTHTHTHTLCEWSLMCMTHYLGVKLNLAETPIKHPHTHTPAAHISNRLCVCVCASHAIVYPIIFRVS